MHLGFIVKVLFLFQNLGMWKRFNPNPEGKSVGDCTVRAICAAMSFDWLNAYDDLCTEGRMFFDMPSSNAVFGSYLHLQGFQKFLVQNRFDNIITIRRFADMHPRGIFVLATGTHVVTVIDGDYYDSWDSGNEIVIYYYTLED